MIRQPALLGLAVLLWGTAGLAGCAGNVKIVSPARISDELYLLQPGDQLEISVWGNVEQNHKGIVEEDGFLRLPGLGELPAASKSIKEIEGAVQEILKKKYLPAETPEDHPGDAPLLQRSVSPSEIQEDAYRLQPGDSLSIQVWNHGDLNREVVIREDGSFAFSLIGEVKAAGRGIRDIEREILQRLDKDYIVNPGVSAALVKATFTVLGQVEKPGAYPTDGTLDLLTALSLAGGIAKGGLSEVELIRPRGAEKRVVRMDADQILEGKQPNLRVLPRDTIYVKMHAADGFQVSATLSGAKFTAIGEVTRPGQYSVDGQMDLLTAISQAGGITKFGSSRIEIIRQHGKERWVVRADIERILRGKQPNVRIWPRDTLNVRRRFI